MSFTASDAATLTGAFKLTATGDTCYYFDFDDATLSSPTGTLYALSDVSDTFDGCDGCAGDPCSPCDDDDFASSYGIVGDPSGMFDVGACEGCESGNTGAEPWDGTFPIRQAGCVWTTGEPFDLDGYEFVESILSYGDGTPCGLIQLFTSCGIDPPTLFWQGEKNVGGTPAGRYFRTAGCSPTPAYVDLA